MNGSRGAQSARDDIREILAGRRLIWFGIRGEDGEALLRFPELAASYAVIAPLRSGSIPRESNVTLEALSGVRPDLDRHDIDLDQREAAVEFKRRLLREVSGRCVLMTYRPSAVVSALAFSMADTMSLAGLFKDRQSAFEHKPWVETSLARRGVLGLEWRYVADEHRSRAKRLLIDGPIVLRASRTSGGVGIARASTEAEVDRHWPDQPDSFVAVAPYLDPTMPINFSGCVFADGRIRLHPPSVQLIGIPSCTERLFGYCGNDFGVVASLDDGVLDRIDALGRAVGGWLHEERYRGAFGVDAMVHGDDVRFTEINARFQGSSQLSAQIAAGLDIPDLFMDHLAAMLGLDPADADLSIREWSHLQPAQSHVVMHNVAGGRVIRVEGSAPPQMPPGARLSQLARGVEVDPGATLGCATLLRSVTQTGFDIDDEGDTLTTAFRSAFRLVDMPGSE